MKNIVFVIIIMLVWLTLPANVCGQSNVQQKMLNKLTDIDTRISKIETRLTNVENRLTNVENRLSNVGNRLLVVENNQEMILRDMDKRFEQINARFRDVNDRFGDMINFIIILVATFASITGLTIGFALWDRRTMIRPFETKVKEIEGRLDRIETATDGVFSVS